MNTVTFKGNVMHLEGELPKVGYKAPSFNLIDNSLGVKTLDDFSGKVLVLATVPSLDTPVCDLEGRHFNEEAAKLSDKVRIVMASRDLPFAQARWCGAAGAKNVETLSDYRDGAFGRHYGVLIKELELLARAVFVIDPSGAIAYCQLVPEVSTPPDYAPIMEAIKNTL